MQFIVDILPSDEYGLTNLVYMSNQSPCNYEYVKIKNFVYKIKKLNDITIDKNKILIPGKIRNMLSILLNNKIDIVQFDKIESYAICCTIKLENFRKKNISSIDYNEFITSFCDKYSEHYFCNEQSIFISLCGAQLIAKISNFICVDKNKNCDIIYGKIDENTKFIIESIDENLELINVPDEINNKQLFNMNPEDLEKLGIGGLSDEFSTLFRRAFVSRLLPPSIQKKLNIKHTKGVLLYGPPGTGKTLIARKIGELLNCKTPKIINGPEILSKYVGESEKNIRALFGDAELEQQQKGDKSQLHLIIFDEFDSLCKKRGMSNDGTGVGDNIVNQLLSKIDGVNSLNNILLIGMTNRKDLIDEAILRQGRIEVHIKISLPDEEGRCEIFKIHTNNLRLNNMLHNNVNLGNLAKITKNFSGAEIEGVVKSAESFSLQRHIDKENPSQLVDLHNLILNQDDFISAIKEITPSFGNDTSDIFDNISDDIINYSDKWEKFDYEIKKIVNNFNNNKFLTTYRMLLYGESGSGKTSLCKYISKIIDYPFIKIIHPSLFVGNSESQKLMLIKKIFTDAYQSSNSIIIIDDIERVIDFSEYGNRYSNIILQGLLTLINDNTKKNNKLLIIGTCKNKKIMENLELFDIFDKDVKVQNLQQDEMENVLKYYNKTNYNCNELFDIPIKKFISKIFTE
jgi:vesicle-fusing ATPase